MNNERNYSGILTGITESIANLYCFNKMTQYNILNVKLSNLQPNKLKSRIRNGTKVALNLSSNMIGDFNDETNFPHKLLLTDCQVSKLLKAVAINSSANIKLSKIQLSKMRNQ